jgi:hypothetical protein
MRPGAEDGVSLNHLVDAGKKAWRHGQLGEKCDEQACPGSTQDADLYVPSVASYFDL